MKLTITISPQELHAAVRRYLQDEFLGENLGSIYVEDSLGNSLISVHEDHMIIYPQAAAASFPASS